MQKTLYHIPLGGLGNRLRSIYSIKTLAEDRGFRFHVLWIRHAECNCSITDILQPKFDFSETQQLIPLKLRSILVKTGLYLRKSLFSSYIPDWPLEEKVLRTQTLKGNPIIVSSYGLPNPLFDSSDFNPALVKTASELIQQLPSGYSAYHIRTGDNLIAQKHTDLEGMLAHLSNEIHQGHRVFLATDDEELKASLLQKYGDLIITQTNIKGRDSSDGMRSAVVDFLCLASSGKLFGSYYTSFSEIAAHMNKVPFRIFKKED